MCERSCQEAEYHRELAPRCGEGSHHLACPVDADSCSRRGDGAAIVWDDGQPPIDDAHPVIEHEALERKFDGQFDFPTVQEVS